MVQTLVLGKPKVRYSKGAEVKAAHMCGAVVGGMLPAYEMQHGGHVAWGSGITLVLLPGPVAPASTAPMACDP